MRARQIAIRSLTYYWRTNVAVVLGVATAVAVLAGALLVGDSVRGSLRDLLLGRLGRTDQVIASATLFREQLAQDLRRSRVQAGFSARDTSVIVQGNVTAQNEGAAGAGRGLRRRRSVLALPWSRERQRPARIAKRFISPALARQLGARSGDSILVRVQRPTDIPLESLHGQRDNLGVRCADRRERRAGRLAWRVLARSAAGRSPAVFVPLGRLQQDLEIAVGSTRFLSPPGSVRLLMPPRPCARSCDGRRSSRTLGYPSRPSSRGRARGRLDRGPSRRCARESGNQALEGTGMQASALFTYLANSIRVGDREVPYSLVTALDLERDSAAIPSQLNRTTRQDSIVLNDWAATELQARAGDDRSRWSTTRGRNPVVWSRGRRR